MKEVGEDKSKENGKITVREGAKMENDKKHGNDSEEEEECGK